MSTPLRGDEILSCRHRVCLSRGAPEPLVRVPASDEMEYRRQLAEYFRRSVLLSLSTTPGSFSASSIDDTRDALERGVELVHRSATPPTT